ncbi:MAG: succinate dehydrogenase assembly factor 2 [Variovorax sp.]
MTRTLGTDVSSLPPDGPGSALEAARRLPVAPDIGTDERIGERALSKLKWRCRRGLLENDLFIARFFELHEADLTCGQAQAMETLMDLSDNDLLDLLLSRTEPEPERAGAGVVDLVQLMRTDGAQSLSS